jgi:uncharacterized protein YqeY
MGLREQLRADMQKAAKERSSLALSALRMAIAEVQVREKEHPAGYALDDEGVVKVLVSMVKKRRESVEMYVKGNRPDLADQERGEIAVLEEYLPKGLTPEEIEAVVRETVASEGASTAADFGRVMKALMPKVAGRADGKAVSEAVRRLLAG